MNARPIVTALVLAVVAGVAAEAQAQLFGNRSLGSSVSRRSRTTRSNSSNVGTVSGSERYVRGNRQETNFVGTDSREVRNFVGVQTNSAASRSRTSTSPVRIEQAPDANRAMKATSSRSRPGGMYSPRLAVGFHHPSLSADEVTTNLAQQLAASLTRHLESAFAKDQVRSIEVSLEDGKATLQGEVSSERERTLAGLLALFEPGISEVQNRLVVRPRSAPPRPSPPQTPPAPAAEPQPPRAGSGAPPGAE